MSLEQCRGLWGDAKYFRNDPQVVTHSDVLCTGTALYDQRRKMVPCSGQYRGVPHLHAIYDDVWQLPVTPYDPAAVRNEAPDDLYYWGGCLLNQYGHFLVTTLPRLWMIPKLPFPRPKILIWGEELDKLEQPFMRDILLQIGLSPADFVSFGQPTRVRKIIVPESSFEENYCVSAEYGRFMRRIGDGLAAGPTEPNDTPVYISKARLTWGTAHVVNEDDFVGRLEQAGVDIFHPQEHSVADQVALWRNRSLVSGFLGSGMLTAAFAGRKQIAVLNHDSQIYSNQVLMDRLHDNVSTYHYPHGDIVNQGQTDNFIFNFNFTRPVETAEAFLRVIDSLQHGPPRRGRRAAAATVDTRSYVDAPLGINLSRNRPARSSSILPPHSRRHSREGDGGGAVNGTVDFNYGFHTDIEENPWWEVDLGSLCEIHEVRLFNRCDFGAGSSSHLCILVSLDGEQWHERDRREDDAPFGGVDGEPYRWRPDAPVRARHVRIQLLATAYFHLEQVEVFGEPADPWHLPG